MKQLRVLLALALLGTGCVTSSQKIQQLKLGMTEAEVRAILGTPQSVSEGRTGRLLRYQLSGRNAPPLNPNASRFSDGYIVQLVDDQVAAYGRDDEFQAIEVRVKQ